VDPRLLVGFHGADDAAVYKISDDFALVATTDFFPPIVDDPYAFGAIAAANALSDVFAMGGKPLVALNLVCFPTKTLPLEMLREILQGSTDKVAEAGAVVGGGHTIEDSEVKFGLAVTGSIHPDHIWRNGAVRPGDVLILTKPLGTGLVTSAIKSRAATGPAVDEAIRWMSTLNGVGIEHVKAASVSAVTDVTGFGLVGHGRELAEGGHATLVIEAASIPKLPGIEEYLSEDNLTGGAARNRRYNAPYVHVADTIDRWDEELLFDPQTSGGLLIAVRETGADDLCRKLRESGLEHATVIGHAVDRKADIRLEVI